MSVNSLKKFLTLSVFLLSILMFVACDQNNEFNGGELLNSERMSEIKSEIISDLETSSVESTEVSSYVELNTDLEGTTSNDTFENITVESNSNSEDVKNDIVYWTKSGDVWHLSESCRYIKSSDKISGTVEEAVEAGKERVCSSCGK